MKKLISRWFKPKSDKKDDPFFRKDEEERDIFYPWGYPGDAFIINEKQKRNVSRFINSVRIFFVICCIGYVLSMFVDLIHAPLSNYLFSSIFILFPILYILSMYFFNKKFVLFTIEKEDIPPKKNIILIWFGCILAQGQSIVASIENNNIMIFSVDIILIIFITFFLFRMHITKGYFFNK